MFKTVKAKIIVITVSILLVLSLTASTLAIVAYKKNKALKTEASDIKVQFFAEKINKSIKQLEKDAISLSLIAEGYYVNDLPEKAYLEHLIVHTFEKDDIAIGGGVWFEPYAISPAKEKFCVYAFDNNNKVRIDPEFETERYNYLQKDWYKTIITNLSNTKPLVWSYPYLDMTGTKVLMVTVGAGVYDEKSHKLVGLSTIDWDLDSIVKELSTIQITPNTYVLFADKTYDFIIALNDNQSSKDMVGQPLETVPWYSNDIENEQIFKFEGKNYIPFISNLDNGMEIVVVVPTDELFHSLNNRLKGMLLLLFFTCVSISFMTYIILSKYINKPIEYLVDTAKKIGLGNLDIKMEIEEPLEFKNLAEAFNKMTDDIKEHVTNINRITTEKERMDAELEIAKSIQLSALPSIFPPYPGHKEFDIYALMHTAKEVGGDFYDFFFIDPNHFAFLIADVSGKGIPAALFMMTTKTLIKNIAKTGISVENIMTEVNKQICQSNKEGFFVTAFLCILELSSGKMSCVNAGHNPPLIKGANGQTIYLKTPANIVVGAIYNFKYTRFDTQLMPNDSIILYTDGVTEAENKENLFYGEDRFKNTINKIPNLSCENMLKSVKTDIDTFIENTAQGDDITLLALKYNGFNTHNGISSITLPAKIECYVNLISWLENLCSQINLTDSDKSKLQIAVEEIFVNISTYAYPPKVGDVEIIFKSNDCNQVEMQFIDKGVAYNPLEKSDPDINLSAEDRPVGGLGIFMVKQSMDFTGYEFSDGKNIFTIRMNLS